MHSFRKNFMTIGARLKKLGKISDLAKQAWLQWQSVTKKLGRI